MTLTKNPNDINEQLKKMAERQMRLAVTIARMDSRLARMETQMEAVKKFLVGQIGGKRNFFTKSQS